MRKILSYFVATNSNKTFGSINFSKLKKSNFFLVKMSHFYLFYEEVSKEKNFSDLLFSSYSKGLDLIFGIFSWAMFLIKDVKK